MFVPTHPLILLYFVSLYFPAFLIILVLVMAEAVVALRLFRTLACVASGSIAGVLCFISWWPLFTAFPCDGAECLSSFSSMRLAIGFGLAGMALSLIWFAGKLFNRQPAS